VRVLLGVCGSVAAYKACDIARELMRQGASVHVVMTVHATRFVLPATFAALTGNPVTIDAFDEPEEGQIAHIRLAQDSDLILIAPATAHTIAKLAHGLADDMLSTLVLASRAPVMIAPAMNPSMWDHPATQTNVQLLQQRGVEFIPPAYGIMACGDEGLGRLADPQQIAQFALNPIHRKQEMTGWHVLITAGPTYEPIDPVRFMGNRSSGKMGYALAEAAHLRGAEVRLISGPTSLPEPPGVQTIRVQTARQMDEAVQAHFDWCYLLIAAAAVADYRPERSLPAKHKRQSKSWTLQLVPNPDIVAGVAARKGNRIVVGFAAETDKMLEHAVQKLKKKGLDLIVANDVSKSDRGFEVDTNELTLLAADGETEHVPLMSKREAADKILDFVLERLREGNAAPI
jgi:phosphopantothenoylcysteine decarboxylase/phosphopantothenate--cysteine ligase